MLHGMWVSLMNDEGELTPDEIAERRHWCFSFDGLLVHPEDPEAEFCTCFEGESNESAD